MRKFILASMLLMLLLVSLFANFSLVKAQHSLPPKIPVVVTVPQLQVNITVLKTNEALWATTDSTYQTVTVYKLGDTFAPNITVAYNSIDAYYPVPLDATSIWVKVNGEDLNWSIRQRDFIHVFAVDSPLLNWSISPVPQNFTLTTHYENPILGIVKDYAYLGDYAILIPLTARYGLDSISGDYPGYSWYGGFSKNINANFNLKMQTEYSELHAYSISNIGTLIPLNLTVSKDNAVQTSIPSGGLFPFGVVFTFNKEIAQIEPFSFIFPVAAIVVFIFVIGGLLKFLRIKKRSRQK